MSDPPPKDPIVKPLVDDQFASLIAYRWSQSRINVNGRETLRVEDRFKSWAYVGPNIDFITAQNPMVLNFQWPTKITLPSITMSLNSKNNIDIQQIKTSAPSGCIVVLGKPLFRTK